MSLATDGFSAMMSFLPMRRKAAEDTRKGCGASTRVVSGSRLRRARARPLTRQPAVRRAEKVLGNELAGGRLLIPQHHQHDKLELVQAERVAGRGQRALDHELAVLRVQDTGVF